MSKQLIALALCLGAALNAQAQSATAPNQSDNKAAPAATAVEKAETPKPAANEKPSQPVKKMVDSATINLRTTVTGSQEQPRVLYIMPWQSPETPEMGIQTLSSQADAVFGHVEREELVRKLEASGELDSETDSQ